MMLKKIKKKFLFAFLWLYAIVVGAILFHPKGQIPTGIRAVGYGTFFDPKKPEKGFHHVIVFVLPKGKVPNDYDDDLFHTRYGRTSRVSLPWNKKLHLFGKDEWGTANEQQILANPFLAEIRQKNPVGIMLLGGARRPNDNPKMFELIYGEVEYFICVEKAA